MNSGGQFDSDDIRVKYDDGSADGIKVTGTVIGAKKGLDIYRIGSSLDFLTNGYTFSAATLYTVPTSGSDNPVIYFRNPNASGFNVVFKRIFSNVNVTNVFATFKLFANPTVSANGTTLNPYQRFVGHSTTAVSLLTTVPTVTASGNPLAEMNTGQNTGGVELIKEEDTLGIKPNNALLFTVDPSSNNRAITVTFVWAEVPV